mmetsp:Transcript_43352/g.111927  ORF Transcript_43352/g.111927 Transcript_43352/m.111927 type:complete len:364 (-) Transcript_43352:85-1176(-)
MPGAADPGTLPLADGAPYAKRDWLFCIPVQIGPPTPHARNTIHWLWFILAIQGVFCFLRFISLYDFNGGFWMVLTIALGLYAYKQDMNITYVCCFGLACAANGLFDLLSFVVPWILGITLFGLTKTVLMLATPLAYGMGAALAWHLYHDYAEAHGEKMMLGGFDPMGKVFNKYDPEHIPLASAQKFDSIAGTSTAKSVKGAINKGGAATATGGRFLNSVFGGSTARAPQAAASEGLTSAQQGLEAASSQAADAAAAGRSYAQSGEERGQEALAKGQEAVLQKQEEAKSWFGGVQAQAQDAAAAAASQAAADASRKAVAEGMQQGKDQASNFFSSLVGGGQQQAAAAQQQGAALQQQALSRAAR